ncbi:hypothetical protein OH77DRAFT_237148 [Trametes cingulata]|nr:hypothetical protein OH77DRAFT_237148 [Trametes cingulata]
MALMWNPAPPLSFSVYIARVCSMLGAMCWRGNGCIYHIWHIRGQVIAISQQCWPSPQTVGAVTEAARPGRQSTESAANFRTTRRPSCSRSRTHVMRTWLAPGRPRNAPSAARGLNQPIGFAAWGSTARAKVDRVEFVESRLADS